MAISSDQIQLNPLKHHLGFICRELKALPGASTESKCHLFELVKTINANFVDVYTGKYSPAEIQELIALELNRKYIGDIKQFQQWLGPKSYQMVSLGDRSVWVLRKSEYKTAFVHIHPSRKPPMAVRIHGNALRTVAGLLILYPEYLQKVPGLERINAFRKEFLGLSPVKGHGNLQRVMKVWNMIRRSIE
jgi:hypothetical protein